MNFSKTDIALAVRASGKDCFGETPKPGRRVDR
jgi:hypothetical protein